MADVVTPRPTDYVLVANHHVPFPYRQELGHYVTWEDAYSALGQQQRNPDWFTDYTIEHRAV